MGIDEKNICKLQPLKVSKGELISITAESRSPEYFASSKSEGCARMAFSLGEGRDEAKI